MDEWTVVDEFNKRLGVIMDKYREDLKEADDRQSAAMADLDVWFNEHYDGEVAHSYGGEIAHD